MEDESTDSGRDNRSRTVASNPGWDDDGLLEEIVGGSVVASVRGGGAASHTSKGSRSAAGTARDSMATISSGVLERLSGVRGEAVERFDEIKFEVTKRTKQASRKIRRSIARALNRFRNRDE